MICLPVLSYGCQLWANACNYRSLIKLTQAVFNDGVKVISRAFHTAPHEPLHEITRVPPARFFFDKLTTMLALRLYRVPITSQLRRHLSPDWCLDPSGGLDPSNGGPVTPFTAHAGPRVRAQRPTALEALEQRVPIQGPHADVVAVPPWEVPNWEGRLNHMGHATPNVRKACMNDLHRSLPESGALIISTAGTVSNKGWYDDWMVGGAAAVLNLHRRGSLWTWARHWALGTELTAYDVDMHALAKAMQWLADFFTDRDPPSHMYLLSRSQAALSVITNTRNLHNQPSVLLFHSSLTAFCSHHRDVGITLTWSPVEWSRVLDSTAWAHALWACRLTPLASLNWVQSAAHQKNQARKRMYAKWAHEWTQTRRSHGASDSFAYEHALPHPPDGNNHPLWTAAQHDVWPDGTTKPTRHCTSTAIRLAVGHAFTSDYTRRFRLDIPESENACECGFNDRSWTHLIYACPLFHHARDRAAFQCRWADKSPHELFTDSYGTRTLMGFLTYSHAAYKPLTQPAVPFDPG